MGIVPLLRCKFRKIAPKVNQNGTGKVRIPHICIKYATDRIVPLWHKGFADLVRSSYGGGRMMRRYHAAFFGGTSGGSRPMTSVSLKTALCASIMLAGCSALGEGEPANVPDIPIRQTGTFNNESLFEGQSIRETLLGQGSDENRLPVNKYLWRASLDTISFLPIASVDTFSGVIATDWATAQGAPNERSRVTVFVRDAELTATALDVTVFRETLVPGGTWQSVAADPTVAGRLEDAILTKARQLRIEDVDG